MATYLSAVLALLLLWNVYPKDFNYGAAAGNGLLFYNANVRGLPPCSPGLQQEESPACRCLTVLCCSSCALVLCPSCVSCVLAMPDTVSPTFRCNRLLIMGWSSNEVCVL